MMEKNISVGLVSLGCPRNLVDSEVILGILRKNGFRISNRIDRCDAAVINTCSFVEDARKESVDLIMRAIDLKKEGRVRKIIVCGCLPQRYPEELKKELGEVDAFLGVSDFPKISRILRDCLEDKRPAEIDPQPDFLYDHTSPRMRITPKHYAYVKLTEGCGNRCSYCVIPSVRGELRSRAMGSVVDEVRMLSRGKKLSEINLVGQDITSYGMDRYKKPMLADLLKKVSALKRPRWLRLLYTHPAHYTDELIEVIQSEKGICRYLDLPLQHINDKVLKAMNRGVTKKRS
ncbi:MAG: MiaB/RimO family radical SAM methylthiotransferase [Candidatus Omnitrophota bacterium]